MSSDTLIREVDEELRRDRMRKFWRQFGPWVIVGAVAVVFGFGALDQFRRLREPGLWSGMLAFVALWLFAMTNTRASRERQCCRRPLSLQLTGVSRLS